MKLSHRFRIRAFLLCALTLAAPANAQIVGSASLTVERRGHSATLLTDGRVLIVGGENEGGIVNQAEIFDSSSNTFLVVGTSSARTDHTASLMRDGRVLVAGGRDSSGTLASTEIFNPADNSFSAGPSLNRPRAGHTATMLATGKILLVGGDAEGSGEIVDLDQQIASPTGSLAEPRALHSAALLKDGRVLVAGGVDPADSAQVLDSAEIFDPQTGRFSSTITTMGIARALPIIKVLPDGKVQIIGGDAEFSMEMFNAETTAFNALAHLPPTPDLLAATLGTASRAALISSAITNSPALQWTLQDPAVAELLDRSDYTLTEIPQTDTALVAGGVNDQGEVLALSALVSSSQATVTTDRFDYPPGNIVTIAGAGWQPGESVVMTLHEEPETHPDVVVTSNADNDGNFVNTDFAPAPSDAGRTFTLTAVGSTSLKSAQTAFADDRPVPSITITKVNGCALSPGPCGPFQNPIHLEGTASVLHFQGQLSQYQVQIDWGDGTVDNDSSVNFNCDPECDDFSGTWSSSPDHTYAAGGSITLRARLYHGQAPGNDSTADSVSIQTIVVATTPTVTTAIHNAAHSVITTAAAGSTVHDSVSVTGGTTTPTGTVTFAFYSNGTCTGTPTATSSALSLSSGALDATAFAQGPLAPGSYSFKAHYNGDSNYNPADGPCEALTVSKADPTAVTTVIHDGTHATVTSVPAGTTVHDSVTVAGSFSTPTGTVTFNWFTNGTCTGSPAQTSSTFTLASGSVDGTTFAQTPNASGTFAFQATYNGDTTYNSKVGACEVLTVNKVTPGSFTTDIHNASHNVVTSVDAGTAVHDKATLTANGSLPVPSGTVTFSWFLNGTCTGTPAQTSGTFTLVSGVADGTTFAQTPNASGSYSFQASYSGDGTYSSASASCEPLTVNKIEATVTTVIHNGAHATVTSVAAGTTVHDSASVSGSVGTPGGTVTFSWFTNGTCAGTAAQTSSTFTLASGSVDGTTFTQTPSASGSYAFQATYNGDNTYNSKVGPCEPLTVTKVEVGSFTTDIHNAAHSIVTSVDAGTTVHDKATLTANGSLPVPSGTATFSWFLNGTCTGTPAQTSGTFTLVSGVADGTTFTQTPNTSGSYAFQATYNGDGTYNSKVGSCEVLTVNKIEATVTSDIHNGAHATVTSVAAGTTVHDSASVSGSVGTPSGTVTFSWFTNGTCSGTPAQTSGTFTLVSGAVDGTTFTQTPSASGAFAFQATYNGDSTYNSKVGPCEPLTVNKVGVGSFTTDIHNESHGVVTSVSAGTTVHDKATLTANGALPVPTGSVTFSWYSNGTCTGSPAQTSSAFTLVSGAVDGTTLTQTPNISGSYSFQASYSGDSTYNSATAACELLTVNKIDPTAVSTSIHDAAHAVVTSVAAGTIVHDSASVSGSVGTPSGTVTFSWFTNGTCSGTPAQTSGTFVLVSGGVDGTTFTQTPSASGAFSFQATYNGDGTYNSKVGPCEVLTVGKVPVGSFETSIHNAAHATVTAVAAGTTVHDQATLTANGSLPVPTGTVTFSWFLNGTCADTPAQTSGTFTLTSGAVDGTTFTQTPNTSGSFSFQASYSGDGTYNSATAACEPLTVGKIDPAAVTTAIHNAAHATVTSVAAGTTVHDSAAVSGSLATPTGTITFKWFENGTCSGPATQTSSAFTLTSGAVDGTTFTQTPVDASKSYSFLAIYSGDTTYNAKDAACEVLSLSKIDPAVATEIHDAAHNVVTSVAAGTTVHDKATVSGAVGTPTGTVTFSWFTNATCTGSPSQTSNALALVSGIVDATTFAQTPGASGSFAFQATYGGDNTYNTKLGPCEVLSVAKIEATVATDIHDASHNVVTSVAAGTTVHDKATVTGGVGTPTGTVTFSWFTNGTCAGSPAQSSGALTLASGAVEGTPFAQTPSTSGSFAFQASYSGDGTYNAKLGPCEPLTVNKIDPTVATEIHDASHTAIIAALSGTSVHDSATIGGPLATPTGNVTFKWFSNGACSGTPIATSSPLALSGGTADASSFAQIPDFHVSSTYSFQATYNGDAVYNPKTGPCESLPITLRTTGITTSLSGGGQTGTSITIIAGSSVTDSAILNGATANAGGTVTYTVFSDGTCTTVFASGGTKTVTNGVAPASNAINFTQTGNYFWKVDYSGDISNDASTSGCSEQVTVLPHTITLAFVGGGFVPKITTPLPKDYKSPGVEGDISFADSLRDGVRVDVTAKARNVANSCAKPLTPSIETTKLFSVPVSQGNLDTVQLAFKLFEVTPTAMNTAKKAKCQSLTLEITQFTAVGVDSQGVQSNTLSLLGEGGVLDIVIPVGKKKAAPVTLSERRAAALEEAEFRALPSGTRLPAPDRR